MDTIPLRINVATFYPILLTFTGFKLFSCLESLRAIERRILDNTIGNGNYDSRIRPRGSNVTSEKDGPCNVKVNILIRSISEISDLDMEYSAQITFREQWRDDRLAYNDMAGQIRYLTLTDPNRIWKPDLFFRNEKEGHFHDIIMPNVLLRIYPDGEVLYSIRISLVLACPMHLKYYPLDLQTCSISMASYGYTTEDLIFQWKEGDPVQVTNNLHLPRFTLQKFLTLNCTSSTNTGFYSCIEVNLIFKREFSYYLIHIYIPCIMLVIVSWVSFWLDPNAIPARVSLGVTTLLTMATQISGINASLPPVSYIKAVDVWTECCLTFVFGALLEFALVNYVSRCDSQLTTTTATSSTVTAPTTTIITPASTSNSGPIFCYPTTVGMGGVGIGMGVGRNTPTSSSAALSSLTRITKNSILDPPPNLPVLTRDPLADCEASTIFGMKPTKRKVCPSKKNRFHGEDEAEGGFGRCDENEPDDLTVWFKWLRKFPTRSKRIDVVSRILFPTMFALFNLVYWITYLFIDERK
ncbi:glutamate-gated chloride channel-like [Panonychus citri]|uniref:glutamate-gated chloride channel-like n=1 Tax=Panonychus citri TaxID=50023 RepID=UPI0023078787|nr:glutamate-gated chloride channel-like [Panonychus citri]